MRYGRQYGRLRDDKVKRLKELQTENSLRRRAASDLTLDKLILAEAAKGIRAYVSADNNLPKKTGWIARRWRSTKPRAAFRS
jgi:hypothetical protein